jgi:transposase-like protein
MAISTVVVLYYYGRRANSLWIGLRAKVELLRQYQYLNMVFPDVMSLAPDASVDTKIGRESDRIERDVQQGPVTEIVTRIEQFWSARRATIARHVIRETDCTSDALLLYVQRRVRRQLGWFTDSRSRLESTAKVRERVLPVLYWITFGLLILKIMSFLHPEWFDALARLFGRYWQSYLLGVALIITGASAAMTAYYINQNTRSLTHRYYTQQRFIERWLRDFNERWNFANLPSKQFTDEDKKGLRAEILRFEDLMIEELIDWTHITSHDAIELAP